MLAAIILLGLVVVVLAVVLILKFPRRTNDNQSAAMLLKTDISDLNKSMLELKDGPPKAVK
ncbi:MAG: hypothetical protein WDN66_04980 [Candidatus Saccharibacteria bacterium]